jgi:hypothetical protein
VRHLRIGGGCRGVALRIGPVCLVDHLGQPGSPFVELQLVLGSVRRAALRSRGGDRRLQLKQHCDVLVRRQRGPGLGLGRQLGAEVGGVAQRLGSGLPLGQLAPQRW